MIERRQREQAQQVSQLHQKSGSPHVKRMHSIRSPNDDPEMSPADNISHDDDMKADQFVTLCGLTPPQLVQIILIL